MFAAFGGSVPRIVPDNLKTGVLKHPREGEVVLNDSYREMAAHYSVAVLPGRVRKPKDKASVENTVAHVATWVIAALRDEVFTSLPELAAAIEVRGPGRGLQHHTVPEASRLSTQRVQLRGAAVVEAVAAGRL